MSNGQNYLDLGLGLALECGWGNFEIAPPMVQSSERDLVADIYRFMAVQSCVNSNTSTPSAASAVQRGQIHSLC